MNQPTSYYDEAYFERGWERGTAYDNYSRGALVSPTYRELAEAIAFVFRPVRCLEVGCATGAIVRHLNDLGVEAHGVDVSEWAVSKKLHPNVVLAGAEELPYPDDHFDLVFSSHSLEHVPENSIDHAFDEMDRVAMSGAVQFHLHPIVGTYPYDYDHALAISNLKKDPTHNVLEPLDWWAAAWLRRGWRLTDAVLTFLHDTANAELSSGQMILSKSTVRMPWIQRAFAWNQKVHRSLIIDLQMERAQRLKPKAAAGALSDDMPSVPPSDEWQDVSASFDSPVAMQDGKIILLAELSGQNMRALRVALVDERGSERGVLEQWVELSPGVSTVPLDVTKFTAIEGTPDPTNITCVYFGGELHGSSMKASLTLHRADGTAVRLI